MCLEDQMVTSLTGGGGKWVPDAVDLRWGKPPGRGTVPRCWAGRAGSKATCAPWRAGSAGARVSSRQRCVPCREPRPEAQNNPLTQQFGKHGSLCLLAWAGALGRDRLPGLGSGNQPWKEAVHIKAIVENHKTDTLRDVQITQFNVTEKHIHKLHILKSSQDWDRNLLCDVACAVPGSALNPQPTLPPTPDEDGCIPGARIFLLMGGFEIPMMASLQAFISLLWWGGHSKS